METSTYNIMLPCTQDDFAQFMSGLLGKSQTNEKKISGSFVIKQRDISDIYSLLEQRIKQQNNGNLLQFSVKVFFDDDSSSLFTDINSFLTSRDIYSRKTIRIFMQWVYLIKFEDKKIPEKQTISVACQSNSYSLSDNIILPYSKKTYGNIFISIEHTARTWSNDIEMLLTKYFEKKQIIPRKLKTFMFNNSGKFGTIFGIVLFAIFIIGGFVSGNIISSHISNNALSLVNSTDEIEKKIDIIINLFSQSIWPKYYFIFIWYLIISVILSIVFGMTLSDKISDPNEFHIIITEVDEQIYDDIIKEKSKEPKSILINVIFGILTGLIGNFLFYLITNYFLKSII